MKEPVHDLAKFNGMIDGLVDKILAENIGTPEFRAAYVKLASLSKRVAILDAKLAVELFLVGIQFAESTIRNRDA